MFKSVQHAFTIKPRTGMVVARWNVVQPITTATG